jgi:hypothetical protein
VCRWQRKGGGGIIQEYRYFLEAIARIPRRAINMTLKEEMDEFKRRVGEKEESSEGGCHPPEILYIYI